MKKETEKLSRGWFTKPKITDYFVTDDGKRFTSEEDAKNWEWYLENKEEFIRKYQFSDFSPMFMGLHHIHRPIFAQKFYVEKHNETSIKELMLFIMGKTFENTNKWVVSNTVVKSIKNKMEGWFYVVLDETNSGEQKLYVSEYETKVNIE